MIGIVLVSHSYALAEGARELCLTMSGPEMKIAAAGGLDLLDHPTGTDPMRIFQGIEEVYSEEGVLIFVDMGSALLSADFAIQMLPEEKQKNVRISDAPFIEGAITAAVQARLNGSMATVLQELKTALLPKQEQLGTQSVEEVPSEPKETRGETDRTLRLVIRNPYGLHARPAARLAALTAQFQDLTLLLRKLDAKQAEVNCQSLNAITLLGVRQGDSVEFRFFGSRSEEAETALLALAEDGFGDGKDAAAAIVAGEVGTTPADRAEASPTLPAGAPSPERQELPPELRGLSAAPGFAFGKAQWMEEEDDRIAELPAADPQTEADRFYQARQRLEEALLDDARTVRAQEGGETASIFEAHLMILKDPLLEQSILSDLREQACSAASAWDRTMRALEQSYEESDSPVIRERAADIRDLRRRLLAILCGKEREEGRNEAGILLAEEVRPGDVSKLDRTKVLGLCTVKGSPSSHAALMARSLGIPSLMGMGPILTQVKEGTELILEADAGRLLVEPDDSLRRQMQARNEEESRENAAAETERQLPARLPNGRRIEIFANIGNASDARAAVEKGAEGVGLLRTEFLYLNRSEAPSEEEQAAMYREIARALDGRPLTIRSLDAGGDKEIPYLHLPKDENPFLGYRAIRICLDQTELFRTQLRAVLRVAREYPLRLMFPMISSMEEWRAAKEQLRLAGEELLKRGETLPEHLPTGMMIEIPSAAVLAEEFAQEADFFSIGTNDLTQYTLAVERGNQKLAKLYSAGHPAVLELIRRTIEGGHRGGIPVAVCGEFASDPEGARTLIQLGIDELSVNPPAIPRLKRRIRQFS